MPAWGALPQLSYLPSPCVAVFAQPLCTSCTQDENFHYSTISLLLIPCLQPHSCQVQSSVLSPSSGQALKETIVFLSRDPVGSLEEAMGG